MVLAAQVSWPIVMLCVTGAAGGAGGADLVIIPLEKEG